MYEDHASILCALYVPGRELAELRVYCDLLVLQPEGLFRVVGEGVTIEEGIPRLGSAAHRTELSGKSRFVSVQNSSDLPVSACPLQAVSATPSSIRIRRELYVSCFGAEHLDVVPRSR